MNKEMYRYTPGVCAKCGSNKVSYSDPKIEIDALVYNYECEECHAHGTEIYNIDFSHNIIEK